MYRDHDLLLSMFPGLKGFVLQQRDVTPDCPRDCSIAEISIPNSWKQPENHNIHNNSGCIPTIHNNCIPLSELRPYSFQFQIKNKMLQHSAKVWRMPQTLARARYLKYNISVAPLFV